MARFAFKLPDIGEGISEAEIVAWHVAVGDRVDEDQPLADMMTDKATVAMESPVSGVVVELAGQPGDQVAIGATLAVIETDKQTGSQKPEPEERATKTAKPDGVPVQAPPWPPPSPPPSSQSAKLLASPAVRARAKTLGIDLTQVRTADGRIRHGDLDAFLLNRADQGYHSVTSAPRRPDEEIRVIGLRRKIAENMAASKQHIPHFTYVEEIDVTDLEAMRADLNADRGERPKLTLLPFLIVAICKAVPAWPMMNARYDDEAGIVTRHGAVHLGIATQTDAGLMVPVIRDAQDHNIWQLASEIVRLADAARSGQVKAEDLTGSTLSVTSLGPLGGIASTPVINRPEVAIIGPNRIVERPVIRDGEIAAARLMNLSISCDHRVVDGWDAASFVQAVKHLLETPALLLTS
jgi:2-oxoisovalerate dehydrogenase E2 component (dihydrolipoyl transacylase)